MVFSDPQHKDREAVGRAIQHHRTGRAAIRLLLTQGIRPTVTRSRHTESPWMAVSFDHAQTSGLWFNAYTHNGHSVGFNLLPLVYVPDILGAVGGTPDAELTAHYDAADYEGDAARWLDERTAGLLGVVDSRPLSGHDHEAVHTPTYTSELSACWQGDGIAHLELSGPGMTAVCNLRISRLTEDAAHAVIAAYATQITN
ncbi:hypothetical protein ACI2L4_09990 [Streptomyces sparsogenes]|uniref:hypothetical protein n=1 Tax=Streptomyces sparsogenes TaxID=67365 RepID=UPI00384DAC80